MIYKFKAAKAIIRYEDLIFLQLRDNNNSIPYPNRWAFFGGRLFPNENPQTGLIREIKEELAFELEKPQEFYQWYNPETDTKIIYFIVEMEKKESFLNVNEGQKGNWFRKFDLDFISIAPDISAVKSLL